jgi:hypothetical protein
LKLLDFSGTMVANIMQYLYSNDTVEINEDLIRHMILKSIHHIILKYKQEGNLIISCDSNNYWRKDIFPYYKIGRKKSREESLINWTEMYKYMRKIKQEIADNFSYPIIEVDGAESDDIIGVLVRKFSKDDKILILSRDKDFVQLQKYPNVSQYSSVDKKFYYSENPSKDLFEKIIKGDAGDSIPNIFSPLDSIALSIRQKPAHQKKIDLWWEEKKIPDELKERFDLNKKLIDLTQTPDIIQEKILESYESQINKKKKNLMNYFIEHNLSNLLTDIQDF